MDFSAHGLPLKPKRFSIFKTSPLLSFYEIVSTKCFTKCKKAINNIPKVLYESDISKMQTCDPFWTLTPPLAKSQLSPNFTVNIYQSLDNEKSKQALVASVTVDLESIIGPDKETMFDVPETDGKTILMLDRI